MDERCASRADFTNGIGLTWGRGIGKRACRFRKVVEDVNVIVSMYMDDKIGDIQLDPSFGTVAFGSGLHQWAFTSRGNEFGGEGFLSRQCDR